MPPPPPPPPPLPPAASADRRYAAAAAAVVLVLVLALVLWLLPSSDDRRRPGLLDGGTSVDMTVSRPGVQTKFKIQRSSSVPYGQIVPGRKYLVYSPSGGFNNQREEFESALQIAIMLNRTLFVPMAGRHTSFWLRYASLRPEKNDLVPMDTLVDFDYLEQYDPGAHLVPLNDTVFRLVQEFTKNIGPNSVSLVSPDGLDGDAVLKLRSDKHPLLYLHGKGMYHQFFAISTMVKIRRRTRYAAHMRLMALRVVKETFPEGFYAFHIRMGDSAYRFNGDGSGFVNTARSQHWKLSKLPVYVATEPNRDKDFFAPIERSMKVTYSDGLNQDLIREFKNEWPKGTIRNDMLGILEQLICTQAKRFIGTRTSTFSAHITFMRKFQGEVFPEMMALESSDDATVDLGGKEPTDDNSPSSSADSQNDASSDSPQSSFPGQRSKDQRKRPPSASQDD